MVAGARDARVDVSAMRRTHRSSIDISRDAARRRPADFTFARTGSGAAGAVAGRRRSDRRRRARRSPRSAKDRTDYRFPLAVYQAAARRKDVDVSLRFKPVAGNGRSGRRHRRAAGRRPTITTSSAPTRSKTMSASTASSRPARADRRRRHQGRSATSGTRSALQAPKATALPCRLTARSCSSAQDDTFADAGKVALWTKADSVTPSTRSRSCRWIDRRTKNGNEF